MEGLRKFGQLLFVAMVLAVDLIVAWVMRRLHLPTRSWVHAIPVYAMGTVATYWFIKRVLMMVPAT